MTVVKYVWASILIISGLMIIPVSAFFLGSAPKELELTPIELYKEWCKVTIGWAKA